VSVIYNEIDPFAAAWLRELVRSGHIAEGAVNEQSIVGLDPVDVASATQFHTFAGIGVWSHALRLAGWPDDRPVWTGSCPCQPFSAAGKRGGFEDERHLWPAWFRLIRQCRPPVIFGEQVASKDGLAWLDAVYADLEGAGYAVGAVDLCAAGVGAPHIRQRLFFVAERVDHALGARLEGLAGDGDGCGGRAGASRPVAEPGYAIGLEHGASNGREPRRPRADRGSPSSRCGTIGLGDAGQYGDREHARELRGDEGEHAERTPHRDHASVVAGAAIGLADADKGQRRRLADREGRECDGTPFGRQQGNSQHQSGGAVGGPGPTNGYWRDPDWLYCRDARWRPVEPGTFPLAHGAPQRVGRLRGYGNAIVAQAAAEVIRAYMESR